MAPSYSGVWNISTQYQYRTGWPFDLNLGSKALTAIGYDDTNNAYSNVVERFVFESAGNSTDFGDLSVARSELAGFGNDTRAVFASGFTGSNSNVIDFMVYASAGNATDFGDLASAQRRNPFGAANNVRGVFGAGNSSSNIYYVTIASAGNTTDFGSSTEQKTHRSQGMVGNTTRGIYAGGSSFTDVIDYFTIPTTGNSIDFGNLTASKYHIAGMSSSTRGVFAGGRIDGADTNVIEYITIASKSNATDFGDLLSSTGRGSSGASSSTKGAIIGGGTGGSGSNVIQTITIASTGNATDFGDLSLEALDGASASEAQAGVQALTSLPSAIGLVANSNSADGFLESVDITTLGNGVAFGDLSYTNISGTLQGASSSTRMCIAGGSSSATNIDLTIFATRGKGTDFGDLTVGRVTNGGSNSTRGLYGGGYHNDEVDTIDYITIASAGNATDFGNLVQALSNPAMAGSTTRMLFMGGDIGSGSPRYTDQIGYVTISSTGNTTDFGNMSQTLGYGMATSSSTRAVYCGGYNGSAYLNSLQYVTIASTGDMTDFGDLAATLSSCATFSNKLRGIVAGGYEANSALTDRIQYFTIASTGDTADFGDLIVASAPAGQSNAHGGIA